jgi:hypothetical protein
MAKRSAGRRRGFPNDITTPLATARPGRRSRAAAPALAESWQLPAVVALVHWLLVQVPATLAWRYGELNAGSPPYRTEPPPVEGWIGNIVNPMRLWDGLWYRLIAVEGYDAGHEHKAAFWPLYPWGMRVGHNLFGITYETAGYLISNIAFIVALVLLYRLLILDFDRKVAAASLWTIALFPTALFFNAVYSESLFLALLVGALYCARIQQWWLAGILGAFAAVTRSYGMFLVLPFAILIWQQYGQSIRRAPAAVVAAAMPLLGPAIFSWHLDRSQGNWQAWMDVQKGWNRYRAWPWETMRWAFSEHSPKNSQLGYREGDGANWDWVREIVNHLNWDRFTSEAWRLSVANSDTLELVCTLLFFVLALVGLKVLPLYQTVYLWPGLLVPLFQPSSVHALMSMPRFGLTLFPLFAAIGYLVAGRRIAPFLAVASAALLILLTVQFSQWYWVS